MKILGFILLAGALALGFLYFRLSPIPDEFWSEMDWAAKRDWIRERWDSNTKDKD